MNNYSLVAWWAKSLSYVMLAMQIVRFAQVVRVSYRVQDYARRRAVQFVRILRTMPTFIALDKHFRVSHPTLKKNRYRIALFKYVRNYLARPLDCNSRAAIILYHYHFILRHMTGNFIDLIFSERIPLWRDARHQHSVTLAYPRKDQEGDLSLEFNLKGTPLCNLSFTFIHGGKLGLPERTVLFVSRLQGSPGMFDVMRETTKQLNDVSIFSILLTSAQAIARTLDVSITAITAQSQTVVGKLHNGSTHKHRYDTMWESFGGERANETFYTLPVNPFSKPLAMTSKNHRAKRVKQRDFKRSIFNKTIESFSSHCILPCRRFIVNDSNTM